MARGSIRERVGVRGSVWVVTYDAAPDPATGKRRQRRETCRTKREAERLLAKRLVEVEQGSLVGDRSLLVRDLLDQWLRSYRPGARSSWLAREVTVRRHLKPRIGAARVGDLTVRQVQDLLDDMAREGFSYSVRQQCRAVLLMALGQAELMGVVPKNVARLTTLGGQDRRVPVTWSADEAARFMAATVDDPLHLAWYLMLVCQLRVGEMVALRWSDVDWDRSVLRVERTLSRVDEGWDVHSPKTASGRRAIALDEGGVALLRRHRARQAERRLRDGGWDGDALIDRGLGRPYSTQQVRHYLDRACRLADVPVLTPHGLRHTGATLLMQAGVSPRVMMSRLGHSSVATTLDLYAHAQIDDQRAGAASLGAQVLGDGDQIVTKSAEG